MRAYIIRRLLLMIPTLLLLTILVFLLVRFIPGDVVDAIEGQLQSFSPGIEVDREAVQRLVRGVPAVLVQRHLVGLGGTQRRTDQ